MIHEWEYTPCYLPTYLPNYLLVFFYTAVICQKTEYRLPNVPTLVRGGLTYPHLACHDLFYFSSPCRTLSTVPLSPHSMCNSPDPPGAPLFQENPPPTPRSPPPLRFVLSLFGSRTRSRDEEGKILDSCPGMVHDTMGQLVVVQYSSVEGLMLAIRAHIHTCIHTSPKGKEIIPHRHHDCDQPGRHAPLGKTTFRREEREDAWTPLSPSPHPCVGERESLWFAVRPFMTSRQASIPTSAARLVT